MANRSKLDRSSHVHETSAASLLAVHNLGG